MEREKTAVALGLFDGVHLGHRAVLAKACSQLENGLVPAAFTFKPESAVYKNDSASGYIYGSGMKQRLIDECGIKTAFQPAFESIKELSGEEFVRSVLVERMNAAYVCCGRDFRFGRKASCGVSELAELGRKYSFTVNIADDVRVGGEIVSSSGIRTLLREGGIDRANELLGAEYTIYGEAVHGKQIGRTMNFPTVNQLFGDGQLVPAYGVYVSAVNIDGRDFRAVTNIGVKPTISVERSPLAETHILGFSGDLYGKVLEIRIMSFIRPERMFSSLDELKAQISADILKADI